jgi:hypothetical protein
MEDFRSAAKKLPVNRNSDEQALVDFAQANGMTEIKNLDHAAGISQRVNGTGG